MKNRKKLLIRIVAIVCALLMCICFAPVQMKADETESTLATLSSDAPTIIMTYEELLQIYDNPAGSYQLGADIDLAGATWKPLDFTGQFYGNGYAILNVNVNQFSDSVEKVYEVNYNEHDSNFAGFFGTLKNATISDLKILGINVDVSTDNNAFAAGFAGYMDNSTITKCVVEGTIKLTTGSNCFGVGGFVGFGNGRIENSDADVTLISIDHNNERDEQFTGGAFALGYVDVVDSGFHVQGFTSEHGFIHDGGIGGMRITYPEGNDYAGAISNNAVSGFIKYFEDVDGMGSNCGTYFGVVVSDTFERDEAYHTGVNDGDNFVSEEIYDYDADILPCRCGNNAYADTVVESTESTNGYTEHKCNDCGYYYRDNYKVILNNPQPQPVIEPQPDVAPKAQNKKGIIILAVICAVIAAGVIAIFIIISKKSKEEKLKELRRKRRKR